VARWGPEYYQVIQAILSGNFGDKITGQLWIR
jgi:hypothetical protein